MRASNERFEQPKLGWGAKTGKNRCMEERGREQTVGRRMCITVIKRRVSKYVELLDMANYKRYWLGGGEQVIKV